MSVLTPQAVTEVLQSLPHWKLEDRAITRHYRFADFAAAMVFVNEVAQKAEQAGHHPDVDIRYNKVKLGLFSHDQGGVTDKDVAMAHAIDSLS